MTDKLVDSRKIYLIWLFCEHLSPSYFGSPCQKSFFSNKPPLQQKPGVV